MKSLALFARLAPEDNQNSATITTNGRCLTTPAVFVEARAKPISMDSQRPFAKRVHPPMTSPNFSAKGLVETRGGNAWWKCVVETCSGNVQWKRVVAPCGCTRGPEFPHHPWCEPSRAVKTTFVQVVRTPSLGLLCSRGRPKNATFFRLLLGDMYATVTMFFQVFATPWGRLVTYR